jgi:hypothetical protein
MNADAAMYRAKEMGKNNCQFYTREMNASSKKSWCCWKACAMRWTTASSASCTSPRWICAPAACSA